MPRPIVLWSTPRSVSTAFERMMRERGDHQVFTEPFSAAYYDGPDRVSTRFDPLDGKGEGPTYDEVWQELATAAEQGPVFVKEMPHHLGPHLNADAFSRFQNTFLIRDPAWAVPSMLAKWPDANDEELGYAAHHRAFELAADLAGEVPPVIDAADLRREPERIVKLWCDAVGVTFVPDALAWEPSRPAGWERWVDWYDGAESTGFVPPEDGPPPEVDPTIAARVGACREHYDALNAHRLR